MTLQQLKYIIGISETGSFNKAAEQLYISQPSLTAAVKDVEGEFGITLFNRSSKGISLTNEGKEFVQYARQIYAQYDNLMERFSGSKPRRKKFAVSCQHYSFCVKAFIDMVKEIQDDYKDQYEFAVNETRTLTVIEDVRDFRSEIGILNLSDFNRNAMNKVFAGNDLVFESLVSCRAYVYLWKKHPLAGKDSLTFADLKDFPCLMFDQNAESSFYFAEEILSQKEYPKIIRTTDRATNLNLMKGLNAYCLCSGIISSELNGNDFVAVPFSDSENTDGCMEIGFIKKKNFMLSEIGEKYIAGLRRILSEQEKNEG